MKLSPEIYTELVTESRHFYCNNLGFKVKLEIDGFVILIHPVSDSEILFCVPNSPFVDPIFRPPYSGKGMIFQLEVDDVEQEYNRLKKLNTPIILDLVNEPVNGTHFTITDPNGILIDIVQYN